MDTDEVMTIIGKYSKEQLIKRYENRVTTVPHRYWANNDYTDPYTP